MATVSYPIMVEVEIPEGDIKDILETRFDTIEIWREKIKEAADKSFETSSLSPVITECDLSGLEE